MPDSMIGRWAPLYEGMTDRRPYGLASPTYQAAAEWLRPCTTIEDWGAGGGWFAKFVHPTQEYIAVDGTANPFVDVVADLTSYRPVTKPEGILCRHVLEHQPGDGWKQVLANLLDSFTKRAVVVVFTPFTSIGATADMGEDESGLHVPTIQFNDREFYTAVEPVYRHHRTFYGAECGHYGIETLFQLEQP